MSKKEFKPIGRKADLVTQSVKNEILIYDLNTNKAFCLNDSLATIWQACDGNTTVHEISLQITKNYHSQINEEFVWLALEQLKQENLIENEPDFFVPFEGLSRREIIRKVGFVSLVALPIISTLTAPLAAQAQSACGAVTNRPNGCTCTGATNCISGCCGRNAGMNMCVTVNLDPAGASCRAGCECASGICSGAPLVCT